MAKREGRSQWAKWEVLVVVGVLAVTGLVIALFSSGHTTGVHAAAATTTVAATGTTTYCQHARARQGRLPIPSLNPEPRAATRPGPTLPAQRTDPLTA